MGGPQKISTPQNEERVIGTASSSKRAPKSGKEKLISILNKKELSRRQTMEEQQRRESEYNTI